MTRIRYSAEAIQELSDSVDNYEATRPGYGAVFNRAVVAARELIAANPRIGAAYGRTALREWVLTDFPYSVFYRPTADGIEIVAVAHAKRRRGYFLTRIDRTPE